MTSRSRRKRKNKGLIILIIGILVFALVVAGYFMYPRLKIYYDRYFGEKYEKELGPIQSMQKYRERYPQYNTFGIDISEYQHVIDWESLTSKNKLDFVLMRVSAGADYKDKQFDKNWSKAKEHNILRGAYHYYRPNENSTEQAKMFIETADLQKGDIAPILDIEKYSNIQSIKRLKDGLLNWLTLVENEYGITPIIYTYSDFYFRVLKDDKRFDKFPVWIAHYSESEQNGKLPKGWIFWQFCEDGRLDGINTNVDINICSSKSNLKKVIIK